MAKSGGTSMYCPECKRIRVCRAIALSSIPGYKSGQRLYKREHPDIRWFRRGRRCLTCNHKFVTSEIGEKFLDELTELRQALSDVKKNAEQYMVESQNASLSLAELTQSLELLKALKIYKDAE